MQQFILYPCFILFSNKQKSEIDTYVTICSRSTHGTVQYFLMHFTASIHTGGHTPLSLQSRSGRDRIKRYFDQRVIGARVERDCQCEH